MWYRVQDIETFKICASTKIVIYKRMRYLAKLELNAVSGPELGRYRHTSIDALYEMSRH